MAWQLSSFLCLCVLLSALPSPAAQPDTEIAAAAVAAAGGSAIACTLAGVDGLALLALAVVPWFVVLLNVTPRLTLTIASAAAAVLLLTRASLDMAETRLSQLGAAIFLAAMLLSLAGRRPSSTALIEAAKYCVFPVMVVAVSSEATVRWLAARREILLASGMGAIALQLVAVLLHVGPAGIYYHAGTYANAASASAW